MGKFNETIYSLCSKYDRQDVDKVLNILNEKEKNEIKLRYGDDLAHPKRSSDYTNENSEYFRTILLPKIQDMLNNKIFEESQKPKAVIKVKFRNPVNNYNNQHNNVKKSENKKLTLLELFKDVDSEDLKKLVSILIFKYKQVIYYRHTENLDKYRYFSDLGLKDFRKYDQIYDEAIMILDGMVKDYHVSLSDVLGVKYEDLISCTESLNEEQLNTLKMFHGKRLDVTLPKKLFHKKDFQDYDKAIKVLKKKIEELENIKKKEITENQEVEEGTTETPKVKEETLIVKENIKKEPEIICEKYNYTTEDILYKNEMIKRYGYLLQDDIYSIDIENIIEESIRLYNDSIARERYILGEIYNCIKAVISNNKELFRK